MSEFEEDEYNDNTRAFNNKVKVSIQIPLSLISLENFAKLECF